MEYLFSGVDSLLQATKYIVEMALKNGKNRKTFVKNGILIE